MPTISTKDHVGITIEVEHALSSLLGKQSTHSLTGWILKSHWRRICKRLLDHLERYLKANVTTSDRKHIERIQAVFGDIRQSVRLSTPEPSSFVHMVRLCLLLLGGEPGHWGRRAINHSTHYRLDALRSVTYSQTPKQKANAIWTYCINRGMPYKTGTEDHRRLVDKYFECLRFAQYKEFVDWFRDSHPNLYLNVFG